MVKQMGWFVVLRGKKSLLLVKYLRPRAEQAVERKWVENIPIKYEQRKAKENLTKIVGAGAAAVAGGEMQ